MATLKSLEEYNNEKRERHQQIQDQKRSPCYNRIACPNCGAELVDSNPGLVLTSLPLQKNIHCLNGDYRGFALD